MSAVETTEITAWSNKIRPHLVGAVENIIAAGRELEAAKEALPHGQFGPLLEKLGLSDQVAQRFMRIAGNAALTNPSRAKGLPAAVTVLDELTRIPEAELEAAIERGDVTATTTRQQARRLVAAETGTDPVAVLVSEAIGYLETALAAADQLADHDEHEAGGPDDAS